MVNNEKFALLVRNDKCLELKVTEDKSAVNAILEFERSQLKEHVVPAEIGVIGNISFIDARHPRSILIDFSNTYLGASVIKDNVKTVPVYIEYPLLYEPTITHAFVQYFSEMARRG